MSYKVLQLRRDTAANWTLNDPTLSAGEIGVETDTLKFKIGNGATAWTSLAYASVTPGALEELVEDYIGAAMTDSSSVDFTYDDEAGTITATVLPAGVDHNSLNNYVANKHIDHSGVSIATAANSGLSGGGDITTTRNLAVNITASQGDVTLSKEADGLKAAISAIDLGASV